MEKINERGVIFKIFFFHAGNIGSARLKNARIG